jgi:PilZ domain
MELPGAREITKVEHRCGCRTTVNVTVRVAIAASFCFIGRLRDVSASGAFLVTPLPVPDFGTLRIWLRTPVRGNIESALAGGVVRSAPDGVGIEWLEFAPPCISHLTQDSSHQERAAPGAAVDGFSTLGTLMLAAPPRCA